MRTRLRDDANQDRQKQYDIHILTHKLLNIDICVEKSDGRDDAQAPEENLRQMHLDDVLPDVLFEEMSVLMVMTFRLVVEWE